MTQRIILIFLICCYVFSEERVTSAVILSQPLSVRALGVAEAFTSIEGDVSGIYYNPAGLAKIDKVVFSFIYQKGIAEDNLGNIIFHLPTGIGSFAAGLISYDVGTIELIDTAGNSRTVNAQQDTIVTLLFATEIKKIKVGTNVKFISSKLVDEFSTSAYAFDLGTIYKLEKLRNLSLGFTVANIGSGIKYIQETDPLPSKIKLGTSYLLKIKKSQFLLTSDIVQPLYSKFNMSIGVEYLEKKFALRTGYKTLHNIFTLGLGFRFSRFQLDYGIELISDFDPRHSFSLTCYF